jgi:hypothetical protein
MSSNTLAKKRSFSPLQCTRSPETKRRRTKYEKPSLHVDCTVSPRPAPQLITYSSPLHFLFEPFSSPNNPISYPTGCSQHISNIQQPVASHSWGQCTRAVQPQWIDPIFPYNVNAETVGTCKNSVASSYSIFSSISSNQSPFRDSPEMTNVCRQLSLAGEREATRDSFIAAVTLGLRKLKEAFAADKELVEELLEAANLVLGCGGVGTSTTT